jgi:hypothetical protein
MDFQEGQLVKIDKDCLFSRKKGLEFSSHRKQRLLGKIHKIDRITIPYAGYPAAVIKGWYFALEDLRPILKFVDTELINKNKTTPQTIYFNHKLLDGELTKNVD